MSQTALYEQKRQLRAKILSRRAAQRNKVPLSEPILDRLFALPSFQAAETVLFYVAVRSEVRTELGLLQVLDSPKRLVVPFCVGQELELFHLENLQELFSGRFGILEPDPKLRELPERRVLPEELDFLVLPGAPFDRSANRMGHGHGFFDRLLSQVGQDVPKMGLAFECQLVPQVPTEPHHIPLDGVVTENAIYPDGMISPWMRENPKFHKNPLYMGRGGLYHEISRFYHFSIHCPNIRYEFAVPS